MIHYPHYINSEMFWNRNKNECEIFVYDLESQAKKLKVKYDVTPE